ncbi:hypothetical protein [Caballeronia glathei]|uniref:RNA-binding protein n=1 Tax=Caballeronia glathei TaxID=60547 RepID=A0A069PL83_9BURK|nr:hypothetical protein [Caballeronia glathei]KDR38066.1 RNA-binding protein [Caballeronia glathei]
MSPHVLRRAMHGVCCVALAAAPLQHAHAWMRAGAWGGHASGGAGGWNYAGARGTTASGGSGSWSASGYRGGTASGGGGAWSGTDYRGGTASGGDGSWHGTGAYGGTASGGEGTWHATNSYGTTYRGGYDTYHGGYYAGYHPPTVINHYSTSCYNCGGWNTGNAWAAGVAGLAAGATIGAAAASANTANAYAAGVAAGAAAQPVYVMNSVYPALPAGCTYSYMVGSAYYHCGAAWFSPYYGANGMYYRVVAGP